MPQSLAGVRTVLLDLDGTLLDTAPEIAAAASDMLAELGLAPVAESEVKSYIGKGIPHLVRRTLERSLGRIPDERRVGSGLESFFFSYEKRNGRTAQTYPGVREGLDAMKSAGVGLACVTNKVERFTLPLLRAVGLDDYFSIVISGDSVPRKKPAPDPLLAALDALRAEPEQALMVGDSANDALSARAAGCRVLLVDYGYSEGVDVQTIDCDGIVRSLVQVATFLESQS